MSTVLNGPALPGQPGRGRFRDRTTRSGLTARWDGDARLWQYYRLDWKSNQYEHTGSTRHFQA